MAPIQEILLKRMSKFKYMSSPVDSRRITYSLKFSHILYYFPEYVIIGQNI